MAVLVEGISVVILRQSIESKYPGGWRYFEQNTREKTFCADEELVRVGFHTLQEVDSYIDHLQKLGLVFMKADRSVDVAIVHQLQGIASPCSWLEFGHVRLSDSGARVAACRRKGSRVTRVVTPEDWSYAGSLSEMLRVKPSGMG
ncbi:MAG: hypothetical protein AB9873_18185 [Syntrophobacteraceae bacterium]